MRPMIAAAFALMLTPTLSACADEQQRAATIPLTIHQGATVHLFTVEVARTEAEQQKGLMLRTGLPTGRGMLFPFSRPRYASFWMKDTLIPLDMIFIRADGTIDRIAENMIPQSLEPVVSGGEVSAVLELAGGTAADLGIDEDARVGWDHNATKAQP